MSRYGMTGDETRDAYWTAWELLLARLRHDEEAFESMLAAANEPRQVLRFLANMAANTAVIASSHDEQRAIDIVEDRLRRRRPTP